MFGIKEENAESGQRELNTIIGKGSNIEGKIKIKNSIRIDGKIKGDVTSTGTVTIGADGEVEGTITAANLIIGGRVRGTMDISHKIVLEKNSVSIGDLKTQKLNINEGAVFDGNCIMEDKKAPVKRIDKPAHDQKAGQ